MTNWIPTEFYRKLDETVIKTARKENIARTLMPARIIPGGIGTQQYSYDEMTEVSDAQFSYMFIENAEDVVGRSRVNAPIPVLSKEFRIGRRDLAAARNGNYDLGMMSAESAAYKVTNLENQIVIDGYAPDGSTYEVKGLYQSAGNTYTDSADFGTAGNALTAVQNALEAFYEDEITGNFNMLLNPTQYLELAVSIFGSSNEGAPEMPMVEKLIGGRIIRTNWITAGTGMLVAEPTGGFYEMVIPQDMTTETEELQKSHDLYGKVYECVLPVIYEPNAICTLTSI
jgi:uncharacterized linocin/CFP29 family protein